MYILVKHNTIQSTFCMRFCIIARRYAQNGACAFLCCSNLTSVTMADSVVEIKNYAFDYCKKLSKLTLSNSIAKIGEGAFWNCEKLASVIIPTSVEEIGDYAFKNCEDLKSVILSKSTNVGMFAFNDDVAISWFDGKVFSSMSINELEKEIETLNQQICDLCKEQEYERASQLREKRIKLEKVLEAKRQE